MLTMLVKYFPKAEGIASKNAKTPFIFARVSFPFLLKHLSQLTLKKKATTTDRILKTL